MSLDELAAEHVILAAEWNRRVAGEPRLRDWRSLPPDELRPHLALLLRKGEVENALAQRGAAVPANMMEAPEQEAPPQADPAPGQAAAGDIDRMMELLEELVDDQTDGDGASLTPVPKKTTRKRRPAKTTASAPPGEPGGADQTAGFELDAMMGPASGDGEASAPLPKKPPRKRKPKAPPQELKP